MYKFKSFEEFLDTMKEINKAEEEDARKDGRKPVLLDDTPSFFNTRDYLKVQHANEKMDRNVKPHSKEEEMEAMGKILGGEFCRNS